jgi:hypothetical protein
MNIPADPSLSFAAFIVFLLGLFLLVVGVGILKIENLG